MIIYLKYNPERKREFGLMTTIEKLDGEIFSAKIARYQESKEFLVSLLEKYELLNNNFSIEPIMPVREEENRIVFPYQDGASFSFMLFQTLKTRNKREFFRLLDEYIILLHKNSIIKERTTEEFKKIFGNAGVEKMDMMQIGCIDLNFDNIIIDKKSGKYTLIDYEWTFDFPVPYKFVVFRAISYFYFNNKENFKDGEFSIYNIYSKVGISVEEVRIFISFEYSFQKYVNRHIDINLHEYEKIFIEDENKSA